MHIVYFKRTGSWVTSDICCVTSETAPHVVFLMERADTRNNVYMPQGSIQIRDAE